MPKFAASLLLLLPLLLHATAGSGNQQFLLVFDAGSTGTRLNVFGFEVDRAHSTGLRLLSLKEKKITPGLSAYANFPERVRAPIRDLLNHAAELVPDNLQENTTVIVRATAGLRLLSPAARRRVSTAVEKELRQSRFRVPAAAAVRVISGIEEAEYGWVAVNFLLDAFDKPQDQTFGMLDMGGGSTQITFVSANSGTQDLSKILFRTVHGKVYELHQHSYLGLGLSAATLQMLGHTENSTTTSYVSPCFSPAFSGSFSFGATKVDVVGDDSVSSTDRAEACAVATRRILTSYNLHQPPSSEAAKFVAVSSFYYVASTLHRTYPTWATPVPANLTVGYFADAAKRVCQNPPSTGRYKSLLCFSLNYVAALLGDGYQFSADKRLLVTHEIRGRSASWPLGLAIHYLTCPDRGTSCLKPNAGDGMAASFISAAQLLALLLLSAVA